MFDKRQTLTKRVALGVKFLDGYMGREAWLPKIESEKLNLADGNTCMVGQLFPQHVRQMRSNFTAFVNSGALSKSDAVKCGFLLPEKPTFPWSPNHFDYDILTSLWLEKMAELKNPKSVVSPVQTKDLENENMLQRVARKKV